MEQLSLFPAALRVGAYIEEHGRRLAWDELQVGMTVIYDCSTESHEWLMVTTVEKIIRTPDDLRVILDGGKKAKAAHQPLPHRKRKNKAVPGGRRMREREAREIPGLRYETCRGCGLRWNIAKGQTIPKDGYLCPRCQWGRTIYKQNDRRK